MKPYTYALLAAAAACGLAYSETAYTTPVGYETLSLTSGTNYTGLRLHRSPVAAGTVDSITASSFTDAAVNFGSVLTGGSSTYYIVEFINANGVIQEVTGASASGSTVTLVDNVTALVTAGDQYIIRPADTLASVFGATNSAGLAPGFFGPTGADIVSIPDGAGGFNQFYYDEDQGSWAKVNTSGGGDPVDPATVPLIYVDGIVMTLNAPLSLVVSGEVKTDPVAVALPSGTSFLSSIYPVGATLGSSFGSPATIATLNPGFFGPTGADLFQLPDGLGGFNQYYYDEDQTSWAKVNTGGGGDPVDAATVPMTAGFGFVNEGASFNLLHSPPSAYNSL